MLQIIINYISFNYVVLQVKLNTNTKCGLGTNMNIYIYINIYKIFYFISLMFILFQVFLTQLRTKKEQNRSIFTQNFWKQKNKINTELNFPKRSLLKASVLITLII